ncbi:MAG: SIS domain-containing protein [Patescibacteria group bacterium]
MMTLNQYMGELMQTMIVIQGDESFGKEWQASIELIESTVTKGNTVFIAGNGGSAADAQHIAAEFVGRFKKERRSYPAIALTTDTSALTSIGNDYGFVRVFSRQLEGLGREGDLFIGISTSGNSVNIVHACSEARKQNMKIIGLLGNDGGLIKEFVDVALVVPSTVTAHIQEIHQQIYHSWCCAVDELHG